MNATESGRLPAGGIVLRPLAFSDADDVTSACNDPDIARFLPMVPIPYTRDDALSWISTMVETAWVKGGPRFAVADASSDRFLGTVGLNEPRGRTVSIGYWMAPWARGRGLMTEATRTLAAWAFEQGFGRLELTTDPANEASMRVALGAGFRHEGIRRGGGKSRSGEMGDRVVWSRLPGDPDRPAPRALPDLPAGGLTDGVVTLRRLVVSDAADLYAVQVLPDVLATTVRPDLPSLADATARCERAGYLWLLGVRAEFAIRDAATDAFAGDIGLMNEAPTSQAMIGYSMGTDWRGRGYATRAARLVADWAFDECGVARLVAGTAPDNVGSQRVLERAGFRKEGFERSRLPRLGGGRVDNLSYALLPEDR